MFFRSRPSLQQSRSGTPIITIVSSAIASSCSLSISTREGDTAGYQSHRRLGRNNTHFAAYLNNSLLFEHGDYIASVTSEADTFMIFENKKIQR